MRPCAKYRISVQYSDALRGVNGASQQMEQLQGTLQAERAAREAAIRERDAALTEMARRLADGVGTPGLSPASRTAHEAIERELRTRLDQTLRERDQLKVEYQGAVEQRNAVVQQCRALSDEMRVLRQAYTDLTDSYNRVRTAVDEERRVHAKTSTQLDTACQLLSERLTPQHAQGMGVDRTSPAHVALLPTASQPDRVSPSSDPLAYATALSQGTFSSQPPYDATVVLSRSPAHQQFTGQPVSPATALDTPTALYSLASAVPQHTAAVATVQPQPMYYAPQAAGVDAGGPNSSVLPRNVQYVHRF
eukprot:NODE_228_length_1083_cov_272.557292_g225_i0.p1 GENE.NODE_228_length_1083_cov_272.557292_g225_i0~~NODE_228_length_1083_cov_272.557292_g225_i0.p1  ORF type:complete len:306 (-),score=32.69 NODE_228_length_1083_cov_272.557292_g225_i0:118-1035(-)